jgi:hypothetical protein
MVNVLAKFLIAAPSSAVFFMSAALFIITPLRRVIVPMELVGASEVILPVKVIVPQKSRLPNSAEAVPMSNVSVPLPNCMVTFSLLASSRIEAITDKIARPAVPTIVPFLVTVNDVPLPVIMYAPLPPIGGGGAFAVKSPDGSGIDVPVTSIELIIAPEIVKVNVAAPSI